MDCKNNLKLNHVEKVTSTENYLTLYGYKNHDSKVMSTRKITLPKGKVFVIKEWSGFWNNYHYHNIPLSLMSIPFKIRPEVSHDTGRITQSDVNNLGLNFDLYRYQIDRYFSDAKKSTHRFFVGFWAGPSIQKLDSLQTNGILTSEKNELFLSTALTLNYSYNNITFSFAPIGFDIATTTIGKQWIYNDRRWWGFGIGISPTFLNRIQNK